MTLTDLIGFWFAAAFYVGILWVILKPTKKHEKAKIVDMATWRRTYDSAS